MPLNAVSAVLPFVYALCGLTAVGFAALYGLRLRNRRRGKLSTAYREKHREYFNYVGANLDGEEALRPPAGSLDPLELRVIGRKLEEWMEGIEGRHRDRLAELCLTLGLVGLERGRLRSRLPWVRIDAAHRLGAMRAREAAPELLTLLALEPPGPAGFVIARAAAKCTRSADDLRQLAELLAARAPGSRELAADILASSPLDPQPLYAELLQSDDEPLILLALAGLAGGGRLAAPAALARLADDSRKEVRVKAAKLLLAYPHLLPNGRLDAFLRHDDWEIRAAAAKAAGELGNPANAVRLRRSLRDGQWWVRHHGAVALTQLGDTGFRVLCETAGAPDESPETRKAAYDAIHEALNRASSPWTDSESLQLAVRWKRMAAAMTAGGYPSEAQQPAFAAGASVSLAAASSGGPAPAPAATATGSRPAERRIR
ncbi:MAG: hypothetical protein K0Q94_3534 [Paenibacillus sp.]|nr:hypothetical protein [Paenibacillus sp.]